MDPNSPESVQSYYTSPETDGATAPPTESAMDDLATDLENIYNPPDPLMTYTENMSATYKSSGNPCLDFFFHVVPDTPRDSVVDRLKLAWEHDSATTLKLICNLRGVRGTGKSDKENFYTAALWLHENHPKTLACNLRSIAQFGYLKDLPEILFRLIEGIEVRIKRKDAWRSCRKGKGKSRKFYFLAKKNSRSKDDPKSVEEKRLLRARVPREKRIEANSIKVKAEMEKARQLRTSKILAMAERASERYNRDSDYRFLHDQVSNLFAELLKSDLQSLNSSSPTDQFKPISLAAKWCPSIDSSYDRALLLCQNIAKLIFPRESSPEYENLIEDEYISRVRNRLRKEVLSPLHQALKLPEVSMSANQWQSVAYNRVASVAMRNYTDTFLRRDNSRFREYLSDVQSGKSKIAAGALLPHEIIAKNSKGSSGAQIVSELQWNRMVNDLREKGELSNCLAVCDVSGSMYGTPMEVSVALGLLVAELNDDPWKGRVMTFSHDPQLHLISPGNLRAKTSFIENMAAGFNTDFQKAFDLILELAVAENLSEDRMIKRVFVFSDMEFDAASISPWETDYMEISRKFREKGFRKVPEIVFWNLRDSSATPVKATENGVALVSGFSKNLLTLFLEKGGAIDPGEASGIVDDGNGGRSSETTAEEKNPVATMEAAIAGELYQSLVVYD
ncbi:uncharacterized protein LOC127249355 [Andrographis paniculata]|uniref:uncharacterized protein LOC127249355 n=1 Tax=Andrographis paniculata TaxID=175694 RepID=UPI0021E95BEB|nr:uncharacterized protein LOC127249355 [Andrographis paniculata]